MAPDVDLQTVLRERYGILHTDLESDEPGTDSRTWWVSIDDVRCYVATWVADGAVGSLAAGVQAAAVAETSGVVTGAAVEALGGDRVLLVGGGSLVLRHHLEGRPVDDLAEIGRVLARVHAATVGHEAALGLRWPEVGPERLIADPDLQQAVAAARDDVLALGPLVTGIVHGDPSPDVFLRLDDGRHALVGWSGAMVAPLLHDVASVAMHLGGLDAAEPLLTAYAAADGAATPDLEHLATMLRFRQAVPAGHGPRVLEP